MLLAGGFVFVGAGGDGRHAFVFHAVASGADAPIRGGKSALDWPQWRGPAHDGISLDMGLI